MKIDEKATWKWLGYQRRGGQWVKEITPCVYESIGNPDLKSLDVQAKYLWPKFVRWELMTAKSGDYYVVIAIEGKEFPADAEHKDPATTVLLAVTSLINEGDNA